VTLDQGLGILLVLAILYRYHRNELRKADDRFDKCDKERVLLHNLYYQRLGADFQSGGEAPEQPIEREPETPESRYSDKVQRMKLRLKSMARTRISSIGPALRRIEQRGRPRLEQIRPRVDPVTAKQAEDHVGRILADVQQTVKNGRQNNTGG
jgi:hypothetical protein